MNSLCLPPAQLRDTMSRLAYFRGWDPALVSRLAANSKQFVVAKDTCPLAKGDMPEHMYVLVSGQLRLYIPLSNGSERIVTLVAPGEGFGEASLLTGLSLPYNVSACRDSHVIAIDAHAYLREVATTPAMMGAMLNLISMRLMVTLRDMEICSQPSSLQRVIRFLICHQPNADVEEIEIDLPGRKRDIAAKLGLTQETFSRVLGHLGQQGVITVNGGAVLINSLSRLRQMDVAICDKDIPKIREIDPGQAAGRIFAG